VLEGEHLVEAYLARGGRPETLVVAEPFLERPAVRALARHLEGEMLVVPSAVFASLAVLPVEVGVLAVIPRPAAPAARRGNFVLALDEVQDPGNVGSMLRSAAAAGISDAYLSPGCAFAWSPKVLRAGMGAHFSLEIHEGTALPAWAHAFRAEGGTLATLVAVGGQSLFEARLAAPLALVTGNEGAGVSAALRDAADLRLTIPMPGGIESLNAAAAAAIALFECVRRGVRA